MNRPTGQVGTAGSVNRPTGQVGTAGSVDRPTGQVGTAGSVDRPDGLVGTAGSVDRPAGQVGTAGSVDRPAGQVGTAAGSVDRPTAALLSRWRRRRPTLIGRSGPLRPTSILSWWPARLFLRTDVPGWAGEGGGRPPRQQLRPTSTRTTKADNLNSCNVLRQDTG